MFAMRSSSNPPSPMSNGKVTGIEPPLIETEAYGLVNARILYANPDDSWEVALFGTNLTDEEYVEHGSISPAVGLANVIAGRPREWGLSVEWRF